MNKDMLRIGTAITALLMLVFTLVACGGGGGGYGGGSTPPATSSVISTACTGPSVTVTANGTASFVSSSVTISVNQVVEWNNPTSGAAHTVTSTTVPANGTFNVSLPIGGSVCLKFTATGAFHYQCTIHTGMTGTVTVN